MTGVAATAGMCFLNVALKHQCLESVAVNSSLLWRACGAVLTIAHVLLVVFIIIAGFTQAKASNWSPFAPQVW